MPHMKRYSRVENSVDGHDKLIIPSLGESKPPKDSRSQGKAGVDADTLSSYEGDDRVRGCYVEEDEYEF